MVLSLIRIYPFQAYRTISSKQSNIFTLIFIIHNYRLPYLITQFNLFTQSTNCSSMKEQDRNSPHRTSLGVQQVNQYEFKNRKQTCFDWLFEKKKFFFISNQRAKNFARVLALLFLILAAITFYFASQVRQITIPYSIKRDCISSHNGRYRNQFEQVCNIDFKVNQTIPGPVYLVYYISNIYINHKKYIKSFSKEQLSGKSISVDEAYEQCHPIVLNKDLPWNMSWGGVPLDPQAVASPCGLKPLLFFNDTYKIIDHSGKQVNIKEKGILKEKQGFLPQPHSEKYQWINPTNEHFQAYMLDGALKTKKRVWGIIQEGLSKGDYKLKVQNNYQLNEEKIHKGIVLSNSTIVGVLHYYISILLLGMSLMCLAYSFLIMIKLDSIEQYVETSLKLSFNLQ